jgi:hypothetical protein
MNLYGISQDVEYIDYVDAMREAEEKNSADKNKVLNELKKVISVHKFDELQEFLKDDGKETFNYKIVDESKIFGSKQTEPYWFKHIFISQSVGYLGDDYSGTIFIPISKDKFFKFEYVC